MDGEMAWADAVQNFGIPLAFCWSYECEDRDVPFPSDVLEQLNGRPMRCGVTVIFLGESFTVVEYYDRDKEAVGVLFNQDQKPSAFFVHSRFIDLNS
jgi:hypothetical protein